MFELIKTLLDLLKNGLNFSNTLSKDKKIAKIGVELFEIYQSLNLILISGYEIIEMLEAYSKRMKQHLITNDDSGILSLGGKLISYKLVTQRLNIARFGSSVKTVFKELNICSVMSRVIQIIFSDEYAEMPSQPCNKRF